MTAPNTTIAVRSYDSGPALIVVRAADGRGVAMTRDPAGNWLTPIGPITSQHRAISAAILTLELGGAL